MTKSLLSKIHTPQDVKALTKNDLPRLIQEIRTELIETVTKNGGHLASNLGLVELTVAIHRIFSSPQDHIIFDVGHQSYVHKLLTGRYEAFDTLRQSGGLSGFTKRTESVHDPFGAGHSSTSLSAALGFAYADYLNKKNDYTVVILGDGAYTGGMIHEALNNINRHLHLLIILNENDMSISETTGEFKNHLTKIRSSATYFAAKEHVTNVLHGIPLVGNALFREVHAVKKSVKDMFYHTNYFEDLGIHYFGPVDGNDYPRLERVLTEAKKCNCCALVHIKTKKGCGYPPAEANPGLYHALPPGFADNKKKDKFDPAGGYSSIMGNALKQIMLNDRDVVAITAAMAGGTGLREIRAAFPRRFFDVGIAEEHALTFAAGLRAAGKKPLFAVYSSFFQRGYDQMLHDVALQDLPITLCIDRCGLNEADGVTHHGIFDVSMLLPFPNVALYAPMSSNSLMELLSRSFDAAYSTAIRYGKKGPIAEITSAFFPPQTDFEPIHFWGDAAPTVLFITYGNIAAQALAAAKQLQMQGTAVGVILCEQLSPIHVVAEHLRKYISKSVTLIAYVEEGIFQGGFSMAMSTQLHQLSYQVFPQERFFAVFSPFVSPKKGETIWQCHGLETSQIVEGIENAMLAEKQENI